MKNIRVIINIIAICFFLMNNLNANAQLHYLPQYNNEYKIQDDSLFNVACIYYKHCQFNDALNTLEKISKDYMKSMRRDYIKDWKIVCQQHLQDSSAFDNKINMHYLFEPVDPNLLKKADSLYYQAIESMSNREYNLA